MRLLWIAAQGTLTAIALLWINRYRRSRYGSSEARAHRSDITTVFHDGGADGA